MQLNHKIAQILLVSFFLAAFDARAQLPLYDNPDAISSVKNATSLIYNWKWDSVEYSISEVKKKVPNHPVVPLLEAISILWYHIPILNDSVFNEFSEKLLYSAELAANMPEDNPEAVYFEMAAKGLLAEYLADQGQYMKAFGQAKSAYFLLKDGWDLSDQIPDFLFAIGLYNYFIEVYPEKNPFYKPLVWFFKSGDPELGLQQLNQASREAILVDIESSIYLAYIYLRYEETPPKAQKYLLDLIDRYPGNLYFHAKVLESYNHPDYYDDISDSTLFKLKGSKKNYYQMAGLVFSGIKAQYVLQKPVLAKEFYELAIQIGEKLESHGEYYKSYAYYNLGIIYKEKGNEEFARSNFQQALNFAEMEDLRSKIKSEL